MVDRILLQSILLPAFGGAGRGRNHKRKPVIYGYSFSSPPAGRRLRGVMIRKIRVVKNDYYLKDPSLSINSIGASGKVI
jgi:hypothetical protein